MVTLDILGVLICVVVPVSGGDQGGDQGRGPGGCDQEELRRCTQLLTRALDRHDLGFVTTEPGLNSLCK